MGHVVQKMSGPTIGERGGVDLWRGDHKEAGEDERGPKGCQGKLEKVIGSRRSASLFPAG